MKIIITYTSIDGFRSRRVFSGLKGARLFAAERVGQQEIRGGDYAVSSDGVGKITWSGVTRAELFSNCPASSMKLNKETTFYARGNELFCREAGYTFDHVGQLFARVIEVNGFWKLRNVDQRGLVDEEANYSTRQNALAAAKYGMTEYLQYLNQPEGI